MKKNDLQGMSPNQKIEYAVHIDADLSREQIRSFLEKDLKSIMVVLADLMRTSEAIDALTDVYYQRYTELHKKKVEQPELNLDQQ